LGNVPGVTDVNTMLALMREFGVVADRGPAGVLVLNAADARSAQASYDLVRRMRASILVLAPLLARFGSARVSLPGGCAIGTRQMLVQGVAAHLRARHDLITDRIEAGTYAIAAAITGGHLEILGAHLEHLGSVGAGLESAGAQIWPTDRGLMVVRSGPLQAVDLTTEPYPGFPTDLQAQFMALMAIA